MDRSLIPTTPPLTGDQLSLKVQHFLGLRVRKNWKYHDVSLGNEGLLEADYAAPSLQMACP